MGALNRREQFTRNHRGNVLVIFALGIVMIVGAIGVATDIHFKEISNTKLVHMLDAAGLAAAKAARLDPDASNAILQQIAQDSLNGQMEDSDELDLNPLTLSKIGDQLQVNVTGKVDTGIMHVFGYAEMPLNAEAIITFGIPSALEVALVLDTSKSMDTVSAGGTRLEALQSAATTMVETLIDPSESDVKMSIVPFGSAVNVGLDRRDEIWLNVQPDVTDITPPICRTTAAWERMNCPLVERFVLDDGRKKAIKQRDCHGVSTETAVLVCGPAMITNSTWFGCVASREIPRDILDAGFTIVPVDGVATPDATKCAPPLTPMTNRRDRLIDAINALEAEGNTYIPAGLTWGMRTLSADIPFTEAAPMTPFLTRGGIKALVLMSDGRNSVAPIWNGQPFDGQHEDFFGAIPFANKRTEKACAQYRSQGVEIYTIAFGVSDPETKLILEGCATLPGYYFDADDADGLHDAFAAITSHLMREISVAG